MKKLVYKYGAVLVSFYVTDEPMRNYKKGVFEKGCTSTFGNHAVAVVGYGTENKKPYWLIKNSWGITWGEKGYGKISSGKNICGIEHTCIVMESVKSGTAAPAPAPTPAPPAPIDNSKYDITKLFGIDDLT